MGFWNRLRIMILFLKLVKDPTRTDLIFDGIAVASREGENEIFKKVRDTVLSHGDFRTMYERRYLPPTLKQEDLASYPEGSFGRALERHLRKNQIRLEMFPRLDPKTVFEYISARMYLDHDLWHTLLGYGISVEDELAVQGFGVAQLNSPVAALLITGGLLHLLIKSPPRAVAAIGKVAEGYRLGRQARFLLAIPLYELLKKPLEDVRRECGLGLPLAAEATEVVPMARFDVSS